jgi:hypothetical protein
VQWRRHTP